MEPEIKPTGTNVVPNRADFLGVGWIQRSPPCQSGMAERQHNGVVASQFVTVNTAAPNRIPTSVWTDPRSNRPWVVRVWLSTGHGWSFFATAAPLSAVCFLFQLLFQAKGGPVAWVPGGYPRKCARR